MSVFGLARVDLLHGQVGIAGDEGEGGFGEVFAWGDFEAGDSVDDAGRVFEAGEDDAVGEGFVLEADVGVEHWAFALAGEVDGEEIGEGEVFAWGAELVVEAGFVSGDEAAAVFNEGAELIALRVAEGGDVGEDEGFVVGEMRGVEVAVVDHLEGDA